MKAWASLPRFPLLVLPLCVGILQHRGIEYWTAALSKDGRFPGWDRVPTSPWGALTSLALEVLALWAWWSYEQRVFHWDDDESAWVNLAASCRKGRWLMLAGLTTALLIAGPLYQVSRPLWVQAQVSDLQQQRMDKLDSRAADDRKLAITRAEHGFATEALSARIGKTESAADEALVGKINEAKSGAITDTERRLMTLGHLALLCLLTVGVVASVIVLSSWARELDALPQDEPELSVADNPISYVVETIRQTPDATAETVRSPTDKLAPLVDAVLARLHRRYPNGASGAEVASLLMIDKPSWSRLKNHRDNVASGKRGASAELLSRVVARLDELDATQPVGHGGPTHATGSASPV